MAPDPAPFARDSMMWRINREQVVLLGGPAAAVLQVSHPQVAMGVAAHSKFRRDTMGRLRRTLDAVYTVAFGSAEEITAVRARVANAHRIVRGEGYSAFDPDAQLWVLATLIMGSVTMYRRFVGTLSQSDLDQFLTENVRFGDVFGLAPEHLPQTWSGFECYWKSMIESPLLGSHPLCAEVANAVIRPDAPLLMNHLSPLFHALAVEYIPPGLCDRLRLSRPAADSIPWTFMDRTLPTILRHAPAVLRFAPKYREALRNSRITTTQKKPVRASIDEPGSN